MSHKSLITTAIAYANADPHIGHAFEFVVGDTLARYYKTKEDCMFITGMDEHGQKIEQKAMSEGVTPSLFVDRYASSFQELDKKMSVAYDFFVRTSDKEKHYVGARALWEKLVASGDIVTRAYTALYCVGCEEFKQESDLNEQGECPAHKKKPDLVEEENYFFLLSKYSKVIQEKIASDELRIYPASRKNEILALCERGLEDVSFSRPITKVSWGIKVPGDDTQVMYVWCDALSNYITALGYGTDTFDHKRAENMTHIIGKDILRFHAAIWPGMLLSAGLPLPKNIIVHGHITSGGHKMSKTLGNVILPQDVIELFRTACGDLAGEALRFTLLHEVPTFEDGDITIDTISAAYTAHLANGIGNLTNRIMKMAISNDVQFTITEEALDLEELEQFNTHGAMKQLMQSMSSLDEYIATHEPFKVVKVDAVQGKHMIHECLSSLSRFAQKLAIFMPKTSAKIIECIRENKMPETPLFSRLVS